MNTDTGRRARGHLLIGKGGVLLIPTLVSKSSVGKEERGAKEETEIENTRSHLPESTQTCSLSQGWGKGEMHYWYL